jgi:hypothetical protein
MLPSLHLAPLRTYTYTETYLGTLIGTGPASCSRHSPQANADWLLDPPTGSCEPSSPRNTRSECFLVRGMPLGTALSAAPDSTQAGEFVFERCNGRPSTIKGLKDRLDTQQRRLEGWNLGDGDVLRLTLAPHPSFRGTSSYISSSPFGPSPWLESRRQPI